MADIKITALKNGPYKDEGPIKLFYGDLRVDTSQPTVFLCRCGASSKKAISRRHAFQNRLPGGGPNRA